MNAEKTTLSPEESDSAKQALLQILATAPHPDQAGLWIGNKDFTPRQMIAEINEGTEQGQEFIRIHAEVDRRKSEYLAKRGPIQKFVDSIRNALRNRIAGTR